MDKIKIYKFDAAEEILGRLATKVALILRGKDSADFSPNNPESRKVIIYNTDKIKVTGNKMEAKVYNWHSGYPGGIKTRTLKEFMAKDSCEVVRKAVYGMLPKNKLRSRFIKSLTLLKGSLTSVK